MTVSAAVALLAAASACHPTRPPSVIVEAAHERPVVASTYRFDEMRELARRVGHAGAHPVLGFYAATFDHTMEPSSEGDCPGEIVIRLVLGARHVEVPSDALARGCRPEALAEHYLLHADADDAALSRLSERVRDGLLPGYDADRARAFAHAEAAPSAGPAQDACHGGEPGSL